MTAVAEDVLSRPVHVSISHRLCPLNNKSRVTTADCRTGRKLALVEKKKKRKGRGRRRRTSDQGCATQVSTKCHGKLEGRYIFTRNNNPFRNRVISIRDTTRLRFTPRLDFELLHQAGFYSETMLRGHGFLFPFFFFFFLWIIGPWRRDVVLCEDDAPMRHKLDKLKHHPQASHI